MDKNTNRYNVLNIKKKDMNLLNELLGQNTVSVWIAGVFWVLVSLFAYKVFEIVKSNKVTYSTFKIKYWLNANIFVVIFGFVLSLITLRLGDYAFSIAEKFGYEFGETKDFVAWMIPLTWVIQFFLEKYKKPAVSKDLKKEMHDINCKH